MDCCRLATMPKRRLSFGVVITRYGVRFFLKSVRSFEMRFRPNRLSLTLALSRLALLTAAVLFLILDFRERALEQAGQGKGLHAGGVVRPSRALSRSQIALSEVT